LTHKPHYYHLWNRRKPKIIERNEKQRDAYAQLNSDKEKKERQYFKDGRSSSRFLSNKSLKKFFVQN
jgi:hypothetical protein